MKKMTHKPTEARQDELAGRRERIRGVIRRGKSFKHSCDYMADQILNLSPSVVGGECPSCCKGKVYVGKVDKLDSGWRDCPKCNGTGQKLPQYQMKGVGKWK